MEREGRLTKGVVVKMLLVAAVVGSTALLPAHASAQSDGGEAGDSVLSGLIEANRYSILGEHDALRGPGLELLIREGRQAEFFLLGESHLTVEIPLLATRLALELRDAGFDSFAIETGPGTARFLVEVVEAGDLDRIRSLLTRHPRTFPFFDRPGELEMLRQVVDAGYEVWGLDQEFLGSGAYWLERLAELAPETDARARVRELQDVEEAGRDRLLGEGDASGTIFQSVEPAELAALGDAFPGIPEARAITDALAASAEIYQLFRTDNYESNRVRIRYMKENLAARLREADARGRPARTFIKFGSFHLGKGYSPVNQLDLGNFAHEVARLRGGSSLHLMTAGLRVQTGPDDWVDLADAAPFMGPLLEHADPEAAWTLYDLRPLRGWFHSSRNREANPQLAEWVFRYDYLALASQLSRAAPLVEG